MENYLTPDELRRIAELCESLDPLWDVPTAGPVAGLSVDLGTDDHIGFNVYDESGTYLGRVSFGEEKGAFYPAGSED